MLRSFEEWKRRREEIKAQQRIELSERLMPETEKFVNDVRDMRNRGLTVDDILAEMGVPGKPYKNRTLLYGLMRSVDKTVVSKPTPTPKHAAEPAVAPKSSKYRLVQLDETTWQVAVGSSSWQVAVNQYGKVDDYPIEWLSGSDVTMFREIVSEIERSYQE